MTPKIFKNALETSLDLTKTYKIYNRIKLCSDN